MAFNKRIRLFNLAAVMAWMFFVPASSRAQSLVTNWEFDEGESGWWIGITGDATGSYDIDGSGMLSGMNSLRIQVTEGGTVDWYVMPVATVPLEMGKKYDLFFLAVADQPIAVSCLIGESGGAYAVYWQKTFTIADSITRFGPFGTSKRPYTWECNRNNGVFELKFLFGKHDFVTVWLDSVALTEHVDTAVRESGNTVTADFRLEPNYPNPFNPHTTIRYSLPKESRARLAVYDAKGREAAVLYDGMQSAGSHSARWTTEGAFESGVYFIRLEADGQVVTRKTTLIK